jgi:hypothetical protein
VIILCEVKNKLPLLNLRIGLLVEDRDKNDTNAQPLKSHSIRLENFASLFYNSNYLEGLFITMKKLFIAPVFFLSLTLACGQEKPLDMTMDFEEYDPPSSLVVPEHRVSRAKFPFIDVHNHQFGMTSQNLAELVADMDKMNMQVMVNLSGRGRGSTGKH